MRKIRRVMPIFITGIMVILLFVLQFTIVKGNKIDETFWLSLAINAVIVIASAITWMSAGSDRAKSEENSPYKTNSEEYSNRIQAIEKAGHFNLLEEFCEEKTKEMISEKEQAILSRVCIDYDKYLELRELPKNSLKEKGYSKKQINAIYRVSNGGRFPERLRSNSLIVRPLRSMELTTNNSIRNKYDIHYNDNADKLIRVFIRVITSIVVGAALAYITFELSKDITDMAAWAMFLMKLIIITFTAWSAEREGYERIVVTKNGVILRRISFLILFNEWIEEKKAQEEEKDHIYDKESEEVALTEAEMQPFNNNNTVKFIQPYIPQELP